MPRQMAIQVLSSYVTSAIHDMCDTDQEFRDAHHEARDAFNALGVTDAEIGWDQTRERF